MSHDQNANRIMWLWISLVIELCGRLKCRLMGVPGRFGSGHAFSMPMVPFMKWDHKSSPVAKLLTNLIRREHGLLS